MASVIRVAIAQEKSGDTQDLVDRLRGIMGRNAVISHPGEASLYSRDASNMTGVVGAVCFPTSTAQVAAVVGLANQLGRPFLARGSGTGLAGGAVPTGEPIVLVLTRMDKILEIDLDNMIAWIEPGVINLDLTRQLAKVGMHFAPDPSSQQSCTIGGNVANNSGGPHCLAYGVTSPHIAALEVVLPDSSIVMLGSIGDGHGLDLRGVFIGSEGTCGVATKIAVRLTPNPPAVRTLLLAFSDTSAATACVSAIISAGLVPAALEMMDQRITNAVEDFVHAGYPRDAAAVLLVEIDGLPAGCDAGAELVREIGEAHGAMSVRLAADDNERMLLWKGRKTAFGAVARIKPNYYLHDTVVPRSALTAVLQQVYEIADRHDLIVMNVFHAGDGNLHPLLVFDAREPGIMERVHAAGEEIVRASLAAGGVLSGEHGIGLEKRDLMPLQFSPVDLAAQDVIRSCFDPFGLANPLKVLPHGSRCGDSHQAPAGLWI